ncbi:MAG: hypothetical protein ACJ8H8_35680 [Geminicoccaceae bacterium]
MAVKPTPKKASKPTAKKADGPLIVPRSVLEGFSFWIEGVSPLVVHAWSLKAKNSMLRAQGGDTLSPDGKVARNPQQDFLDSVYTMEPGVYGFPVMGIKNAVVERAHKDKGVARVDVKSALFFNHSMHRVKTAHLDAMCSMPLVRLFAGEPEMREDMVKVGSGLSKTATLAYRAQFWPWAIYLTGRFNTSVLNRQSLAFLIEDAGMASGIGEWRTTRNGVMGCFGLCGETRARLWDDFREGRGPLPDPSNSEFDLPPLPMAAE